MQDNSWAPPEVQCLINFLELQCSFAIWLYINHPVTKGAQCYIYNIWRNIWIQDLSNYIAQTLCTWLYKADFIMASFAHVSNLAHRPLVFWNPAIDIDCNGANYYDLLNKQWNNNMLLLTFIKFKNLYKIVPINPCECVWNIFFIVATA